jgi:hypothetical protein
MQLTITNKKNKWAQEIISKSEQNELPKVID